MDAIMPRKRPDHLHRETSRHGTVAWYYRPPGGKRTRIRGQYGTPEFWANLEAARSGAALAPTGAQRLSLAWCIEQFTASPAWVAMAPESRKQMGYQFARIRDNAGTALITQVRRKHVIDARDRRAAVPSDANKYVRAMAMLCRYAVEREWIAASPVTDVGKLRTSKTGEGFRTWTPEDMAAFEAHWPIGTMQRLAYEIILCTGLRRGDVHRFGRQHVKGNTYTIRTSKTGMIVESVLAPRLAHAITATRTGDMCFLMSETGQPFASKASFGNWFGDACRAAGVAGSAHGIRKAIAAMAAEGGVTEAQLNAMFGWSHGSRESATYIQKASRAKMAGQVVKAIARTMDKGAGNEISNQLKRKAE